jgi:hypothetical protein
MATLETKERQQRRTVETPHEYREPGRRGLMGVVLGLLVAAVVGVALAVMLSGDGAGSSDGRSPETEDAALERLVNEGYIPKEALDGSAGTAAEGGEAPTPSEQDLTDRFINEGLIPG